MQKADIKSNKTSVGKSGVALVLPLIDRGLVVTDIF